MENPNSFDQELKDVQEEGTNPEVQEEGTEQKDTENQPTEEQEVDYKVKFTESAKEAQRLYAENKKLKESVVEKTEKTTSEEQFTNDLQRETELYPGFEELDEEAQKNLLAYKEGIKQEIYKDPAIQFAQQNFAETKWNQGFEQVLEEYPELKDSKEDFKREYFNPKANIPENIGDILKDVAKIHLFDKAKELGAEEERKKADRIDLERVGGGDKSPTSDRTLAEWNRLAAENPAKFAKLSKEYNADLESGKLKE